MHTLLASILALQIGTTPLTESQKDLAIEKATIVILQKQCEEVMGWGWKNNDNTARANLGGVISIALLESYNKDTQPSVWVTLNQYVMHLKKIYLEKSAIPFKADIEFLAKFAKQFDDKNAARLSKELFARIRKISPHGQDEYKRISEGRADKPELIGYEISLAIRAAHALNEVNYAQALADATLAHKAVVIENGNDHSEITSAGAFVYALSLLEQKKYGKTIQHLSRHLQALQRNNGSWALNHTQATAYALLGLSSAKEYMGDHGALKKARHWLMNSQLKAGGWGIYNDGLPEPFVGETNTLVQAETLRAILNSI
ncbi:MAG: hypothetical protein QGI45_01545 [Myxococcota bacterium]|jgi:hypothetical protein|nr:hypothetical protein [Myxococcota bacterium]